MKKTYTLLFTLLVTIFTAKAQYLTENFESGQPADWTFDAYWNIGDAGSMSSQYFSYTDHTTFVGVNDDLAGANVDTSGSMKTSVIDLTGANYPVLSFELFFVHGAYNGAQETFKVKVSTDGGTSFTEIAEDTGGGLMWRNVKYSLVDYIGQSIIISFEYYDGGGWTYGVGVDDVSVYDLPAIDVEMLPLTMLPFAISAGDVNIDCKFKNQGGETITSLDINYQIDNEPIVTESLTGLNIELLSDSYSHTFSTPWTSSIGTTYNINVWVSNVNGNESDDDTANDAKNMTYSVASQTTQNKPLFELFTSSTCGPCAGFNGNIFNPFMAQHDNISVIKYQSNGPGSGDPYYTPEVGVRASYYGQNGVPQLYVGATDYATPGYVPTEAQVNQGYDVELAKLAMFAPINPSFSLDGNIITIDADITPYVSGNFNVYVAVIEKETTGNTGTNGETSFEHVMMKMLPDAMGETVNFIDGTMHSIHHEFDMSSTFMEDINDLAVVVFVQDKKSKYVFQSGIEKVASVASIDNAIFTSVQLYPNPSKGIINIKTDKQLNFVVTDVLGKVVLSKNTISKVNKIDISNLNNGVYFIKISDGLLEGVKKIILNK